MKKTVLWSAILLLGVGCGYLVFRAFRESDPQALFQKAIQAYQKGSESYEKGSFVEAKRSFDDAHRFAQNALNAMNDKNPNLETTEQKELAGAICYLHARAVRDRYYSELSAEKNGREPETPDTTTGQTFRDFHRIKDPNDQKVAINFLRNATTFLPGDKALVQDVLRMELTSNPLDWNYIEKLARATLAIQGQENDPRALYLLARVQLFQPDARGNIPASKNRSQAQMLDGLGFVEKIQSDFVITDAVLEGLKKAGVPGSMVEGLRPLKGRPYKGAREFAKALPTELKTSGVAPKILRLARVDNFPLWRTLYLHALLHDTILENTKEADRQPRIEALHKLLFDPNSGIIELAKAGASQDRQLHPWDLEGLMNVWLIGLDLKIEKIRRENDNLDPLRATFLDFLAFCDRLEKTTIPGGARLLPRENIDEAMLQALIKTQKMTADVHYAKDWVKGLAFVRPHLDQSLADALADRKDSIYRPVPNHVALYCDLQLRKAWSLHKSKQFVEKEKIQVDILQLLRTATQVCEQKLKLSAAEYFPLLSLKAEMAFTQLYSKLSLLNAAEKKVLRQDLLADLKLLREITDATALKTPLSTPHALALLLDGALDERDGKLETARDKLEEVIKLDNSYEFRAHAILANIFLAMNQPDKALPSLRTIEGVYKKFDDLSFIEKKWINQFIRDRDDLSVAIIQAQYDRAYLQLRRYVQQRPNSTASEQRGQMVVEEREAKIYLDRLPIATQQGRQARQYYINHLQRTLRLKEAKSEYELLRTHYPNSIEILRVGLQLEATELSFSKPSAEEVSRFKQKSEDDILRFIAEVDPANVRIPKLFYVSWLANIGMGQKALDYLQDPKNFNNREDEDFRQVQALVMLTMNKRSEVEKLLENLPHDSRLDIIRIRILSNLEAKAQQIQGAIIRHEEEAILRIMEGETKLRSMQYDEAAQRFFYTLDYTRVKAQAQAGLTSALFLLARDNPDKTRDKIEEYLKVKPREPVLYLGYAACCLAQDDIGKHAESWDNAKNMSSALQQWMKYSEDRGLWPLYLTIAEFHIKAQYPDRALADVNLALKIVPGHMKARTLAITLNLQEKRVGEARKHLQLLKDSMNSSANSEKPLRPKEIFLLEAEIEWADGQREKAVALLEEGKRLFPNENLFLHKLVECYQPAEKWARSDAQHAENLLKAHETLALWQRNQPSDPSPYLLEITNWALRGDEAKAQAKEKEYLSKIREFITRKSDSLQDEDPKRLAVRRQDFLDKQELLLELELCKHYLQGNALQLAQRRLLKLEAAHPRDLRIANLLAQSYHNQKKWALADQYYGKVLAEDPYQMDAAANAAWVKAFKLDPSQVQSAFDVLRAARLSRLTKQEMEGDRLSLEFLDTLGLVYRKITAEDRKYYPELVATFVNARRRYPYDPRIIVHLAYGYVGVGQDDLARSCFNDAEIRVSQNISGLSAMQLTDVHRDIGAGKELCK